MTETQSTDSKALRTPVEVDTDLAAAHHQLADAQRQLHWTRTTICHATEDARGIRARYTRAGYVPQVTDDEALAYVRSLDPDAYRMGGYSGSPRKYLAEWDERTAAVETARATVLELEKLYTGWSRFFLVTSSAGHVHSSRSCSTCRPTTGYGWLPKLSGLTEVEAVAQLGAVLCSVCFPSAPVEFVGGKVTKAAALKMAA